MKEGFIIVWEAYGEWKSTTKIWTSEKEAQKHIDKVLTTPDRDYNKNCQIIPIKWSAPS